MKPLFLSVALLALLGIATSAHAAPSAARAQRVEIAVTPNGFEPASIPVKLGRPVVLVVTRRTDRTCAREIVIASRKLRKALPLNRPVEVRFVAHEPGPVRFACGMDMIAGTILVE